MKTQPIYHVATYFKNSKKNHVVLQARKDVDYLNCEAVDYFGERITTKKQLKANKDKFLSYLRTEMPAKYSKAIYISID